MSLPGQRDDGELELGALPDDNFLDILKDGLKDFARTPRRPTT